MRYIIHIACLWLTIANLIQCTSNESSTPAITKPYVYFLGNSVTYVHDIPGRLHKLFEANNIYPEGYEGIAQTAHGGHRLIDYIENHNSDKNAIYRSFSFEKKPRYLILQEQSCGPNFPHNLTERVLPHYQTFASYLEAEIILYQTWHTSCALSDGNRYNEDNPQSYQDLADASSLAMAPIGDIWKDLKDADPNLLLTPANDPVHQNELGASINAVTFFYVLNPDSEMVPNILAQTGLSISQEQDNYYNQIIYNKVHNHIPTLN